MPTEIALTDGTKFEVVLSVDEVKNLLGRDGPEHGWVSISEGGRGPDRHINPAHVVYVREAVEKKLESASWQ